MYSPPTLASNYEAVLERQQVSATIYVGAPSRKSDEFEKRDVKWIACKLYVI